MLELLLFTSCRHFLCMNKGVGQGTVYSRCPPNWYDNKGAKLKEL